MGNGGTGACDKIRGETRKRRECALMDQYLGHRLIVNVTEDMYDKLRKHSEFKWSEIARKLIAKYLEELDKSENNAAKT
jgi:hypothetical protein